MGDTKEHMVVGSALAEVSTPDGTWQKLLQLVREFRDQTRRDLV